MDERGCTGSGSEAATEQAHAAAGRCSSHPAAGARARGLERGLLGAAAGEQARGAL